MTIESAFEDFAKTLTFKPGKREIFLSDLKRSVQQVPGGFRNKQGAKVDLASYMAAMSETGLYTQFKPSLKEKYAPAFPVRSEGIKSAHRKLTETILQKAFAVMGYQFIEGTQEAIIEHISNNFLPSDDDKEGLTFRKINDTPIGSVFGKESYSLESLLNNVGASRFLDDQATRITRLAHKGSLRQKAQSMAELGAKNTTIEKLVEELEAFEKRSLKVGKRAPVPNIPQVEEEFKKMMTLNGSDSSSAVSSARISVQKLDDIQGIKAEISKIQPANTSSNYDFNE